MRSSATRGTGQLRLNSVMTLASAIVIVRRARPFRRNHGSVERIFRCALHGKRRTFVRLLDALQNQSADALRRFAGGLDGRGVTPVGIILLKAAAQLESTRRNLAQPAPRAVYNLKDLSNPLLRRTVA